MRNEYQKLVESTKIKDALREKSSKTDDAIEELQKTIERWRDKAKEATDTADQLKAINEETGTSTYYLLIFF